MPMTSMKMTAIVGSALVCVAAPVAYVHVPQWVTAPISPTTLITAALNDGLAAQRALCWGATQVSNAQRYESGQDGHLVFSRQVVTGFTGALLDQNNPDMRFLQVLAKSGAIHDNPKTDTRKVNFTTDVKTYHLVPTKRSYWQTGRGFCVGTPRVMELLNHTAPGPDSLGVQTISAAFRWRYHEVAEWAEKIPEPQLRAIHEATSRLTVHDKGYTMVDIRD